MTYTEAIEIIKIERDCVKRNTDNKCDRDCINCDLLRADEDIFAAYDVAIKALEKTEKYQWIPVKVKPTTEDDGIDVNEYPLCLDFQLPDERERILVSRNGLVDVDANMVDDIGPYLDGWGNWVFVDAWMPLPEPYKRDGDE